MNSIARPKKIKYEKGKEPNQGKIIIEPCFPGYGITLGNTLRRVLLSSLPGAAPVGIKIDGINHEFTTLSHLKEDILEFILNLKQLRLKVFTDEVVKLELKVHGKKEIKASDIKKNSQVEIINKDLVLGDSTDMAGGLKAEIFVAQGMGYETIESRENTGNSAMDQESEVGFIEMDSIFSPVLSTGIKIENVRVGKMTNWDKLIFDIKTDGTITPEEAFHKATAILIEQFNALAPAKKKKDKEVEKDSSADSASSEQGKEEKSIDEKDDKKDVEPEEEKPEEKEEEAPKKKRGRPKKLIS